MEVSCEVSVHLLAVSILYELPIADVQVTWGVVATKILVLGPILNPTVFSDASHPPISGDPVVQL